MTKPKAAPKPAPETVKGARAARAAQARAAGALGGRPAGVREQRDAEGRTLGDMARAMSFEALQTLREIHADPTTPKGVRVAASEAILRRGWADAPPVTAGNALDGVTINVQQLIVQGAAVPGILQSPVAEHIAPATEAAEVIDVDGSTVQALPHEGP